MLRITSNVSLVGYIISSSIFAERKEAKAFNVLYRLNVIQNTVFGNVVTGVVGHTCIRIFSQETLKGRNILVKYPFVVYINTALN